MTIQTQKFEARQNMNRKSFEIFHYREAKPNAVAIHHHDFYEIYFFLGGDVLYWVEGKEYQLEVGDILLMNPMELHHPITKSGAFYERIVLWIDRNYLSSISTEQADLTSCFKIDGHRNLLKSDSMLRGKIKELFELLIKESYENDFGSNMYAEGLLVQLMVEINRMARKNNSDHITAESVGLVNRVTSYINNHYSDDISLDTIAKKFYVSKYYLSHEFGNKIGIGVCKYLNLKRLSVAKELLAKGHPSGDVALQCGFHNYTTFYRVFKDEYGISPMQFIDKIHY